MLNAGKRRLTSVSSGAAAGPPDDTLTEADFFEAPKPGAALAALDELENVDEIRAMLATEERYLKTKLEKTGALDPTEELENWCFVGPPGTGKTTVARGVRGGVQRSGPPGAGATWSRCGGTSSRASTKGRGRRS